MAEIGKAYFENLFKAYQQAKIVEVIQTSLFFPERILEEENADSMEEVWEDELKTILHSFHKDKILAQDG